MTPSAGPRRRFLVLFALIYAVQGVDVGYLFNFNKPFLRASGLGVGEIGTVFARGVDMSGGFRVPTLVAAGVTLACLPLVVPLGRPGPEADPAGSPA